MVFLFFFQQSLSLKVTVPLMPKLSGETSCFWILMFMEERYSIHHSPGVILLSCTPVCVICSTYTTHENPLVDFHSPGVILLCPVHRPVCVISSTYNTQKRCSGFPQAQYQKEIFQELETGNGMWSEN